RIACSPRTSSESRANAWRDDHQLQERNREQRGRPDDVARLGYRDGTLPTKHRQEKPDRVQIERPREEAEDCGEQGALGDSLANSTRGLFDCQRLFRKHSESVLGISRVHLQADPAQQPCVVPTEADRILLGQVYLDAATLQPATREIRRHQPIEPRQGDERLDHWHAPIVAPCIGSVDLLYTVRTKPFEQRSPCRRAGSNRSTTSLPFAIVRRYRPASARDRRGTIRSTAALLPPYGSSRRNPSSRYRRYDTSTPRPCPARGRPVRSPRTTRTKVMEGPPRVGRPGALLQPARPQNARDEEVLGVVLIASAEPRQVRLEI